MKLTQALEKDTTLTFVKVAGAKLTVMNDKNDLIELEIADGQLPKETVVGTKLNFLADGSLKDTANPQYAPAKETGRRGCLEQRVQA